MFQIQALAYQILGLITNAAGDKYEEIKPRAEEIVADTKDRLTLLAQNVLDGQIQPSQLPGFAEDELTVLKTELLETAIIAESAAQEILNTTIEKVVAIVNSLQGNNAQ